MEVDSIIETGWSHGISMVLDTVMVKCHVQFTAIVFNIHNVLFVIIFYTGIILGWHEISIKQFTQIKDPALRIELHI